MKLAPQHSPSGTNSMLNFFTGALDAAYMGSSPLVLGHLYGLDICIAGVANSHRASLSIVRSHRSNLVDPKLGTVMGSDGHVMSHVFSQTLPEDERPIFVNLTPDECLGALKTGMIDYVALWEPYVSLAAAGGGTVVFDDRDLDFTVFSYIACTRRAVDEKYEALSALLAAHLDASQLLQKDPAPYSSRLRTVFGAEVDVRSYQRLLSEGYEWPTEHLLAADRLPSPVVNSLNSVADVHRALQGVSFSKRSLESLLPLRSSGAGADSDEPLQLGYSNSIMCSTFHVADYQDLFEGRGLEVQAGKRRIADRIARLSADHQEDMRLCSELLARDPELVIQKLGRVYENIFRGLLLRLTGSEPKSSAAVIETLREAGTVPPDILSWADSVRSIRNVATHQDYPLDTDEAVNVFNIMLNIVEWFDKQGRLISATAASTCRRCRAKLKEGWIACPQCGAQVSSVCTRCNEPLQPEWKVCPACGNPAT